MATGFSQEGGPTGWSVAGKKFMMKKAVERQGFVLLEVAVVAAMICLAAAQFGRGALQVMENWHHLQTDAELNSAGLYMLDKLERDLCVDTVHLKIDGDEMTATTNYGKRKHTYYLEPSGMGPSYVLYVQTETLDGVGVNPLFIRGCYLHNWQLAKVDGQRVYVSFDLLKENRKIKFARTFYLLNGSVDDEA